ncbi:MAG: hypothetical protein GX130_05250 [Candidatus Hydrogenedens sp.]|jgi:hypothetical protein|nr:hypothetical protein [Candidatus Hydrogenedens sp.]
MKAIKLEVALFLATLLAGIFLFPDISVRDAWASGVQEKEEEARDLSSAENPVEEDPVVTEEVEEKSSLPENPLQKTEKFNLFERLRQQRNRLGISQLEKYRKLEQLDLKLLDISGLKKNPLQDQVQSSDFELYKKIFDSLHLPPSWSNSRLNGNDNELSDKLLDRLIEDSKNIEKDEESTE